MAHEHSCHHPTRPDQPPAEVPVTTSGDWTCPMHPEVRAVEPGPCPKCGMALERVGGDDDGENEELRDMTRRFWASAALTIPLVFIAMGDLLPGQPVSKLIGSHSVRAWIELLLGTTFLPTFLPTSFEAFLSASFDEALSGGHDDLLHFRAKGVQRLVHLSLVQTGTYVQKIAKDHHQVPPLAGTQGFVQYRREASQPLGSVQRGSAMSQRPQGQSRGGGHWPLAQALVGRLAHVIEQHPKLRQIRAKRGQVVGFEVEQVAHRGRRRPTGSTVVKHDGHDGWKTGSGLVLAQPARPDAARWG